MNKKVILIMSVILISVLLMVYFNETNLHSTPVIQNNYPIKQNLQSNLQNDNLKITYKDGVDAASYAFSGMQFYLDKKAQLPTQAYNYSTKSSEPFIDFISGLSTISAYMATGDVKYLETAKKTADFLSKVLPANNIVPVFSTKDEKIVDNSSIMAGTNGQATILEFISYLAKYDSTYKPLMNRVASGLLNNCINPSNNLAWFQINTYTGKPIKSDTFGYESQLGSQSVSCAQALLTAYETDSSKQIYKNEALNILKSIWRVRNKSTNLISETYDVMNNKVGKKLYPYDNFRYDDMGGAYIRGLSMAYLITADKEINQIAQTYIPAMINAVWDRSIDGGAFRYLTTKDGQANVSSIETMHGLFIATLLQANSIFYNNQNENIINKCTLNAEHTIINNFSVKNNMNPHMVDKNGNYANKASDSQLGYSIIQYPLGYELLSQVTQDSKYRLRSNTIVKTLLQRHKIGDNIDSPQGFLNIVETQPPYGFEMNYSAPLWMNQAMYIPSFLLFNSIHPSKDVNIEWYHGNVPGVFGLACDMPFWDNDAVSVSDNKIILSNVTGEGTIDFSDVGYDLTDVLIDGEEYKDSLSNNILKTKSGSHKYEIVLQK